MTFLINTIVVLILLLLGFAFGLVFGFWVRTTMILNEGGFIWMGKKYALTPLDKGSSSETSIGGAGDALKETIKAQFRASAYDADIERVMRRNAARKGKLDG